MTRVTVAVVGLVQNGSADDESEEAPIAWIIGTAEIRFLLYSSVVVVLEEEVVW